MAQRGTTKSSKGSSGSRNSGRGTTTRSSASGRGSASRSSAGRNGSGRSGAGRSTGSRGGGNGGGMMILLKAFLFVLAIALVFGFLSWGLEKMGERGKKSNETVSPTSGVDKPGTTVDPNVPTDTPTPTPEPTKEDNAKKTLQSVPHSKLQLGKELSSYRVEVDDYTSNIHGTECIGVNVLDPDSGMLLGSYYVAVDGSIIFREREDGEFDEIVP